MGFFDSHYIRECKFLMQKVDELNEKNVAGYATFKEYVLSDEIMMTYFKQLKELEKKYPKIHVDSFEVFQERIYEQLNDIYNKKVKEISKIKDKEQQNKKMEELKQNIEDSYGHCCDLQLDAILEDIKEKINSSSYLSGKFYNEDLIIFDQYKDLKTPQYVIIQIKEQLNPRRKIYFVDDMILLSTKYKDKYVEYAEFYPFNAYWAQISDLNEYQLRWYLYWRKEFLNGNTLDTDISYIFIFSYELICYTFNQSAAFNVSALEKLYNEYKELFPKLENYLPGWIDDMLSEVGFYYNKTDMEIEKIEDDPLVDCLTSVGDLEKISINTWREHYNERKSELNNKQLNLIYGNQKFKNKLKKYAGLLAKYYIDNKIDIIQKWFEIKVITEKKHLFNSVPSSLARREGTVKYKKYFSNDTFDHDLSQITKMCYDLIYPVNNISGEEYVINQFKEGKYELPEDFFLTLFKEKKEFKKVSTIKEDNHSDGEFSIDMNLINEPIPRIECIKADKKAIKFSNDEREFLNQFDNGILDKGTAQQFFIKKGIMLNAYIIKFNEKYYSAFNREVVTVDDKVLKLNINMEGDIND